MPWAGAAFEVGPIPTDSDQVGGSSGPRNVVQALGSLQSEKNSCGRFGGKSDQNCSWYSGTGAVIDLPAPTSGTAFTNLYMAAAGIPWYGGASTSCTNCSNSSGKYDDQQFVLTFTDGTTATWTQTISSWSESDYTPGSVSGEVLINAGTQINQLGNQTGSSANLYGYNYVIPEGKILKSITLPTNPNVCNAADAGSCGPGPSVGVLGISLL
jgi:hypothetical protein